jgi:rhodanese-related sulfurtransferase
MRPLRQLTAIVVISLAAAAATYAIKGPPLRHLICDPASLKADEICLSQIPAAARVLWVDARSRLAWQQSGVPGSVLWNLDPAEDMQAFEADVALHIMDTPQVIVYCGDENCGISRQIADRIRKLQLGAQVSVLHGGWRALNEAGLTRH